jgi:hypothetical protein
MTENSLIKQAKKKTTPNCKKQEGHDGPEIAHLFIGPWAKGNFKPGLLF